MSDNLYKYDMLNLMNTTAEITNHELVVVTPVGNYFGKFYSGEKDEEHKYLEPFFENFKKYRKSVPDENNPRAIFLVDVTLITTSHQTFRMPFVCLFIDQILGVSFGKHSSGQQNSDN